jgi:hypothetical protein
MISRQVPAWHGIRVEVIRVGDLMRFVDEFFRNPTGQVMAPISRQRALGIAHNPFADADDPALIVAYDGDKVVAHWCIVAGRVWMPEGSSKVFWGSALFVHRDYRARPVLLDLIRTVFTFKTDFLISGFSDTVYKIYRVLGFRELKPLKVCAIKVSKLDPFDAARKPRGGRGRGRISPWVWMIVDTLTPVTRLLVYRPLRFVYLGWLARRARRQLRCITFQEVQRVRPEAETPSAFPHFLRGVDAVNWMLAYPWVLENATALGLPSDPPYYFSDVRAQFRHWAVEFFDAQGRLAGYLTFSIQLDMGYRVLKLTDFSACSEKHLSTVSWIAALYVARHRVDYFEASSAMSPYMIQVPLARFLVRSDLRRYLYHTTECGPLKRVLSELELQYGDSDCAFT